MKYICYFIKIKNFCSYELKNRETLQNCFFIPTFPSLSVHVKSSPSRKTEALTS